MIPSIDDAEVGRESLYSHAIEIHLAFDLPKNGYSQNEKPLISPAELFERTDSRGLTVGEWFLFDKGEYWSYRSSRFLEIDGFEQITQDDHALMGECLKDMFGANIKSWTLVEQILGLWKTGKSARIRYSSANARVFGHKLTIPQLGRWERSFPRLEHFWGVVPNFLGDTNPDIRDAMLFNLKERRTIYTYFLYSYADLQRLRAFTKSLKEPPGGADFSDQIRPVLLWQRPGETKASGPLSSEYFIANPTVKKCEGYKIVRNSGGYVTHGIQLSKEQCEQAVKAFLPLLDRSVQGVCPPIIPESEGGFRAIAYTDLEGSVETRHRVPRSSWDKMLEDYDELVATETSRVSGEVIKALGDGYLLSFPRPKAAFDFAVRIQKALDRRNAAVTPRNRLPNQKIALDYGHVERVERSHGYDLEGRVLSRCARVINRLKGRHVVMTNVFKDLLPGSPMSFGVSSETIKPLGSTYLRGIGNVELLELVWRDRNGDPIKPLRRFRSSRRKKSRTPRH